MRTEETMAVAKSEQPGHEGLLAEDVGALSRRFNRAIHQLVESLKETGAHIAAPPAVSDFK